MELEKALLLITMTLNLWLSLALLADKRGAKQVNRALAAFLAILFLPLAYFYSHALGLAIQKYLGLMALASIWAKGPLLGLLSCAAVQRPALQGAKLNKRKHLSPQHENLDNEVSETAASENQSPHSKNHEYQQYWHFLPAIIALIASLLAPQFSTLIGSLGLVHAFSYQAYSAHLLLRHRQRLARIYFGYPNSAFYWLLYVVLGLGLIMLGDYLLMGWGFARGQLPIKGIELSSFLITLYMLVIAFCCLYRPHLFFTSPKKASKQAENINEPINKQELKQAAQGKSSPSARELSTTAALELSQMLGLLMDEKQLYLEPELSLSQLADKLQLTTHQCSELLNLHLNTSFYDYVNGLRLDYAQSLLSNKHCQLRIIDIAFESGFSNRNSFYRAFRQRHQLTPTDWRALQIKQGAVQLSSSVEKDKLKQASG